MENKYLNLSDWKKKILLVLAAAVLNLLFRFICSPSECLIIGNQILTLAVSYFLGPVFGAAAAVLTGLLCSLLNVTNLIFIIPQAAAAVITGIVAVRFKFFDRISYTLTIVCILGFDEGILLALLEAIFMHGASVNNFGNAVTEFFRLYNYSSVTSLIISGIFTVYLDVLQAVGIIWLVYYTRNPLKKKIERKKFIKRNMAGTMALVLAAGSLAVFCPLVSPVQAETSSSVSFAPKIYNIENGTAGGTANDIVQTEEGTIWVATYEGLYRYNGKEFEMINDMSSVRSVSCLCLDDSNNVWIGTNGMGISVMMEDRTVYVFDTSMGLPSDSIRDITQVNDTTFAAATASGLAFLSLNSDGLSLKKTVCDELYINEAESDGNGNVVFYDNNNNLYTMKYGSDQPDVRHYDSSISCLKTDSQDRLYVAHDGGVGICTSISDPVETAFYSSGDASDVNDLCFDSSGIIYAACQGGVGFFNPDGTFTDIYIEDYDSIVTKVMQDYQGNIWYTSTRYGILCLQKSAFTDIFSFCNAQQDVVNTETEWGGLLYVGTDSGLQILDTVNGTSIENELTAQFEGCRIRCLTVDSSGSLWICDYSNGCTEITAAGQQYSYTESSGAAGDRARFAMELDDGIMAVSFNSGISMIKNHAVQKNYLCGDNYSSAYALSMSQRDDGTIITGTDGEGIFVMKDGEVVKELTRKDGLSSGVILRIVENPFSSGEFVLSGSGLCYMDEDFNIKEISGFPYYNNLDMYISEEGTVFVNSTAGVFVTSYEELISDGGKNAICLDYSAGLPGSITSNGWNSTSSDGSLYIAGSTGVYAIDIQNYGIDVDIYKPVISAMSLDGDVSQSISGTTIDIPEGTDSVEFTLELNNFTSTNPYVKYYLAGTDENKNLCRADQLDSAVYNGIKAGKHRFVIEVLEDDGDTVISRAVYTVVKEPEEYETWSFRTYFLMTFIALVLTLLVTIINIGTYRTSRKQKLEYDRVVARLERDKAKALETALHHEENANRSKSDFLASMSHEIRTPINAILGMDTMILRESTQEEIRNYALDVRGAGETLLALINDILDFSKIESGKMELVPGDYDLSSVINDLINMVRPKVQSKDLLLEVNVNPDIPAVLYGDDVRIKQIILNILNNAVKYTQEGTITFSIDFEETGKGQIALKASVKDTGIGIKQEDIKKLFSPYERIEEGRNKKIEGTGLGMSITKNLLEMMGSQLVVESEYGKGSTFSCAIVQQVKSAEVIGDFRQRLAQAEKNTEAVELYHAPEGKVLIVDDVEMNLMVAKNLLKRIQVQVTTAGSGQEAIELCSENEYDIVLLDSMMPVMSGEETLVHIRQECELNAQTPVIVLTANAIKGAREEYLELGFDNYLCKPINVEKLEAMLQCYLPDEKIILRESGEWDENDSGKAEGGQENSGSSDASAEIDSNQPLTEEEILRRLGLIEGIDVTQGMETAGGQDIYLVVCRNFYETAPDRIALLEKHLTENDIRNYTIQVHALKSSARLIGAYGLSEKAWEMEQAGRAEDMELIMENTDSLISDYRRLLDELDSVYGQEEDPDDDRPVMPEDELLGALDEMKELLQAFDFDTAGQLFESLGEYRMPESFRESGRAIRSAMAEVDSDGVIKQIDMYAEHMENK